MSYLHDICAEEIALEGLDGITLACLWCRLDQRLPKFPLALDPKSKEFLWAGIIANSDLSFYCLPKPRDLPTFPHEYKTIDEATGIVFLNEELVRKEYPGCIVNSSENNGIQGSCSTFKERVDISDEVRGQEGRKGMTLKEIQERWGDSLVIVASQELRFSTLVGPHGDPSLELSDLRYCLLEYIGRQRHHSANQVDIAKAFKFTNTSMHGYRKDLMAYQLIDRRSCWCETSKQAKNIIVLTLRRFLPFAKHANINRLTMLANHITDFLDAQPKKMAKYKEFVAELARKFPYLAGRKDWKMWLKKTYLLLQKLRVIEVYHSAGSKAYVVDSFKLLKKLNEEKDDAGDDETNAFDPMTPGLVAELPIAFQVYNLIDRMQHTPQGVDYNDMERTFQLGGRFVRSLVEKGLMKAKLIKFNVADEGRQRIKKFQTVDQAEELSSKKDGDGNAFSRTSTPESKEPAHKQTLRHMKRRQRILELIKKNRVQEGSFNMLREIRMEEENEGRTERCDRKSVLRIIDNLEKEGLCQKFSTVVMSDDGKSSRTVNLIMDIDVKRDDPRILHIIQQVKFRMINFKLHHPMTNRIGKQKKTKLKLIVAQNKKPKPKQTKKKRRKRITKYETLAQPSDAEHKTVPRTTSHDILVESNKEDDDAVEKGVEEEKKTGRQLGPRKNMYGCLQKMERMRVLHQFIWYVVYGMSKGQSHKTPQPDATSEKQTVTIKQEFDEDQDGTITTIPCTSYQGTVATSKPQDPDSLIGHSTEPSWMPVQATDQSERLSESGDGVLHQLQVVSGGQVQDAVSSGQSGMSTMQAANQSERLSEAASGTLNQPEVLIVGQETSARSDGTTCELVIKKEVEDDGYNHAESSIHQEETVATNLQTASGLLEFIQCGILPGVQATPSTAAPTASLDTTTNIVNTTPEDPPTAAPSTDQSSSPADLKVYMDVMDWRRFVQPLPEYKDMAEGWCRLGDLILSMPLAIFCKVIPVRFVVDGLDEFLKDPMKQLWLIKDLPLKLRRRLLAGRRYLFSLEEEIDRLCSLGLAIYTPHHNEGKEMLSVYLCRNVTIVDTTSSQPSSYFVSDKAYPRHKHHLATFSNVEKFWFELKVVCLDTPLGIQRSTPPDAQSKRSKCKMTGYARTLESYLDPVVDDGRIPGDGRGAGGLDSSFFSHLKRNWTSPSFNPNFMSQQRFQNRFKDSARKVPGRLNNPLQRKTVTLSTKTGVKEDVTVETKLVDVDKHKAETVGGKGLKRKRTPGKESEAKIARRKRREEKRKEKEERKLHKKQKRAVGIITRVTHNWTPAEDNVMLLCKVASAILNRDLSFKSLITWETVQLAFAKHIPSGIDLKFKDAIAISKRSTRLMRNSEFRTNYAVCLGEVYEDKALLSSIKPLSDKDTPEVVAKEFEDLIEKLQTKFRLTEASSPTLPDDLPSLRTNYSVVPIAKLDTTSKLFFKDENATDLKRLALHSIVLSTLTSQTASDYSARSVFKLYEQYDTNLLHDVFLFCRSKGLINRSKKAGRAVPSRRIVPNIPMSFQLSTTYTKHFKSKIPHEVPEEAVACYKTLLESASEEGISFPSVSCGSCSCQIILLATDQVTCKIIVPKQVIILDSNLIDKDFLEKTGLLKKEGDSSDSESDVEEESESEEEEEEDGEDGEDEGQRSKATIDIKGTLEGTVQGKEEEVAGIVGVSFEEDDDERGKAKTGEGPGGAEHLTAHLEDAKEVQSRRYGKGAMDLFEEIAGGTQDEYSKPSDLTDSQTPLFHGSVTDLDHPYSQGKSISGMSHPVMPSGSGDSALVNQEASVTSEHTPSESGDASRNVGIATSQGSSPSISQLGGAALEQATNFTANTSQASARQAETSVSLDPHQKLQPRNATMKCLSTSQSSFTKWLILQGLYAPGVCGKKITSLQDNIAFNTFTINLTPQPCQASSSEHLQEFPPCSSLSEYLLRPCRSFKTTEAVCKPSDLSQETSYLEELLKAKYITRQEDSAQKLAERCSELDLDTPTTTTVIQVYRTIEEAGLLGLTLSGVTRIVRSVNASTGAKISPEKCINLLLQQQMVLEVGASELRLVATRHASLWTIHSQRLVSYGQSASSDLPTKRLCLDTPSSVGMNIASGSGPKEGDSRMDEIVDLTEEPFASDVQGSSSTENMLQSSCVQDTSQVTGDAPEDDGLTQRSKGKVHMEVIDISDENGTSEDVVEVRETEPTRKDADDGLEAAVVSGSTSTELSHGRAAKRKLPNEDIFEPVEFVPYPWRKADGGVNRPELHYILKSVALLVMADPGITEAQILHHFKDLFRRVDCLKILQMMSDLGLITRHSVSLPKPSLFNTTKSRSKPPVYYYHCSINCLTKVGMLFASQE